MNTPKKKVVDNIPLQASWTILLNLDLGSVEELYLNLKEAAALMCWIGYRRAYGKRRTTWRFCAHAAFPYKSSSHEDVGGLQGTFTSLDIDYKIGDRKLSTLIFTVGVNTITFDEESIETLYTKLVEFIGVNAGELWSYLPAWEDLVPLTPIEYVEHERTKYRYDVPNGYYYVDKKGAELVEIVGGIPLDKPVIDIYGFTGNQSISRPDHIHNLAFSTTVYDTKKAKYQISTAKDRVMLES